MNKEFKIGGWIISISHEKAQYNQKFKEISLYNKIGKIIGIEHSIKKRHKTGLMVEFKEWINGHDSGYMGKDGHCWFLFNDEVKNLSSLKLKKSIKHGI